MPHLWIEHRTYSLQIWCSTTELKGHTTTTSSCVLSQLRPSGIGPELIPNTW